MLTKHRKLLHVVRGGTPIALVCAPLLLISPTLSVRRRQARNLPAADSNGSSDPYVVARFGGSVGKTSIRPVTTNPIWYQTLKLHAEMLPPRIAPKVWLAVFLSNVEVAVIALLPLLRWRIQVNWNQLICEAAQSSCPP